MGSRGPGETKIELDRRRIRTREHPGQRVPIVALTADAMVGTLERP